MRGYYKSLIYIDTETKAIGKRCEKQSSFVLFCGDLFYPLADQCVHIAPTRFYQAADTFVSMITVRCSATVFTHWMQLRQRWPQTSPVPLRKRKRGGGGSTCCIHCVISLYWSASGYRPLDIRRNNLVSRSRKFSVKWYIARFNYTITCVNLEWILLRTLLWSYFLTCSIVVHGETMSIVNHFRFI